LAALELVAGKRRVRLVLDGRPEDPGINGANPKPPGMQAVVVKDDLAGSVRRIPDTGKRFMHHKFLICDGTALWTGSANFTVGGLDLQDASSRRERPAAERDLLMGRQS